MLGKLKGLKDKALSQGITPLIREKIAPYGTLRDFCLDTQNKRVTLSVELDGESEPLHLEIREYKVYEEGGGSWLLVEEIHCSKPWLAKLLQRYVAGRSFAIEEKVAKALRLLA